jgi:hypothetical protein
VYFRISEEEFEQMRKACEAKGARSVSDLARAAVQEFIKPARSDVEVQLFKTLKSLSAVVDEINRSVLHLVTTLNPSGGQALKSNSAVAGGESGHAASIDSAAPNNKT